MVEIVLLGRDCGRLTCFINTWTVDTRTFVFDPSAPAVGLCWRMPIVILCELQLPCGSLNGLTDKVKHWKRDVREGQVVGGTLHKDNIPV